MKTKLSYGMIGLQAAAALCVMGAVKLWAPVCHNMLELANGNQVHMKCYYTGQAAIAVAVILLVAAIMALLSKQEHKKLMVVGAVAGVMLFLLFTGMIGVCASETMQCQTTALWCKGAAIAAVVAALVELIFDKKGQIPG